MKCSSIIWFLLLGFLLGSCSNPFPYSNPPRSDSAYADSRRAVVDSLPLNKDKGINLYWYYYSAGVVGRAKDDYLAINSCSCRLKVDSAFFSAPDILKIDKKGDTVIVVQPGGIRNERS